MARRGRPPRNTVPENRTTSDTPKQTDLLQNNQVLEILAATTLSRADLLRRALGDPRRDLVDECGYVRGHPSYQQYQDRYDRNGVGSAVVRAWVNESWSVSPDLYEDEDPDVETNFEAAWKDLCQNLKTGGQNYKSWNKQQQGNPVWQYLKRLDELSGIGSYGVLLFGLDDVGQDSDLIKPVQEDRDYQLRSLRVFTEGLAEITSFDTSPKNGRMGYPATYKLSITDQRDQHGGQGMVVATPSCHWSRVLHVCDQWHQATSSEIFAPPRMRPVINYIDNIDKIAGSSPEGYYKSCFTGLSFEGEAGAKFDVDRLRDQMENFQNSLQKILAASGGTFKTISPTVVDATPHITQQLVLICVTLGMSMRILTGSESGELASSQDAKKDNKKVAARQKNHITANIIRPFVDRLISYNVLPEPESGEYTIHWPALDDNDPKETANMALTYTQALAAYVNASCELAMPPRQYFTQVWKLTDKEALLLTREAEKVIEEREKEAEEMMEEQARLKLPPNGKVPPSKKMIGERPTRRPGTVETRTADIVSRGK